MNILKFTLFGFFLPLLFSAGPVLASGEFDFLKAPSRDNLAGKCADEDHEEFYDAKDFAYHSSGLDYDIDRARIWALRYNETHACNTIGEFINRFNLITKLAYGSDGFDMDNSLAKIYALQWAEVIGSDEAQYNLSLVPTLKSFLRSSDGLNLTREQAVDFSKNGWKDALVATLIW